MKPEHYDGPPRSLAELEALRATLPKSVRRQRAPNINQTAEMLALIRRETRAASERDRLILLPADDASGSMPVPEIIALLIAGGLVTLTVNRRGRIVACFDREAASLTQGTLTEFSSDLFAHLVGFYRDRCPGCSPSILADIDDRVRCPRCESRLRKKPSKQKNK